MATYFPQFLSSKAMTQLPYTSDRAFESVVNDMPSGMRHARGTRGTGLTNFPTGPLGRFESSVTLTDAEMATLQTFHLGRDGMLEEFIYLDPAGNLVQYSELFSDASWAKTSVTVGSAVADPFGGSLATSLAAGSSNSNMVTTVLPSGDAAGLVVTASIYANAASSGQTLCLGFVDSGFSVLSSATFSIPQNSWRRISHTYTIVGSSYIRMLVGGFGTWNMTTIRMFGGQCVALPAENDYLPTPALYGYHGKCRFDTDLLSFTKIGPDQNTTAFVVKEIF